MVLAPLVLFVLILVMVGFAAVVALALLPIFGAAGEGVNAFRERLDAAGVGRAGIPHLPQSSTIFAADGKTVLAEIFLDENRRYARIGKIAPSPSRRSSRSRTTPSTSTARSTSHP